MGNANTSRTGHTKLMDKHPIHCLVEIDDYEPFRKWCVANGTTPTAHVRILIKNHNKSCDSASA